MAKKKKKKKNNKQNKPTYKKAINNKKNSSIKKNLNKEENKNNLPLSEEKKVSKNDIVSLKEEKSDDNIMADDFAKEFSPNYVKVTIASIFWAIIIIIVAIWTIDIFKIMNHNDPILCLSTTIYEYDDGNITACNGLGYNIYHYERDQEDKYIFRPFFIEYKIEK